jgi:hypothetical protein
MWWRIGQDEDEYEEEEEMHFGEGVSLIPTLSSLTLSRSS